jgi:PAS domain S-box-containing protein
MQTDKALRLLTFFESQNDAQELINQLRNHGYPTRAHQLSSSADLTDALLDETWDLLICDDRTTASEWQQIITRAGHSSVPALLLCDDADSNREAAFATGAQDVIARENSAHLLHATLREVGNRRTALDKAAMLAAHEELQARYELLMDGSQDAIAYLTDGMHIDANDAYASQFGYEDCEELACMPVIDLIDCDEVDRFKRFLRDYRQNNKQKAELQTTIQCQNGSKKDVCMQFSPANYEGEACTQLVIRSHAPKASAGRLNFAAEATRHRNPSATCASLCYIHLENLAELRASAGLLATDAAILQLQAFIQSICPQGIITGQITQEGFGLFNPNADAAQMLPQVKALIAAAKAHIIDIDGRSLRCDLSAMLVNLNASDNAIETSINQAYQAIIDAIQEGDNQITAIYTPPATPIGLHGEDIDLDKLLRDERLTLTFQPVVSLRGEPGEYYEMCCVLQQTDNELLDIDSLAQKLQDKNKISIFDRWLLMNTIQQLLSKRKDNCDTRLIVNLSAICLQDKDLCGWLKVNIKAAGVPPSSLVLQIAEHHVSTSIKQGQRLFEELNSLGCGCSISEFGENSHNSNAILQHVSARMLKLNQSIVADGQTDAEQRQRLQQLLQEATKSGAATIVPNVCSASILATLWQLGASFIQGDYLQQPSTTMEYEFAEIA